MNSFIVAVVLVPVQGVEFFVGGTHVLVMYP